MSKDTFQGQNKVPTPLAGSKANGKNNLPVPAQDIKPEDHKTHSGLKPITPISNQGADDYSHAGMLESPHRSGLQPKKK